jgi:hypothetical protein
MKTGFLPKYATGGFTALPNQALDAIINDTNFETKKTDNLALCVYLARFLPGQKANLKLAFDFSQRNLCLALGWGETNIKRLKRAFAALERLGIVAIDLERGNLLCIRIDLTISKKTNLPATPQEIPMASPEGFTPPPLKENSLPYINNELNKKLNNLNHHLETLEDEPSKPQSSNANDDDIKEIFDFFRKRFASIPAAHRRTFQDEYLLQGGKKQLVLNQLESLAKHPLTLRDITSINAVWHYEWLIKKTKEFDQNSRLLFQQTENLPYPERLSQIKTVVENQGFNFETFALYFNLDEKLETVNHRTKGLQTCTRLVA